MLWDSSQNQLHDLNIEQCISIKVCYCKIYIHRYLYIVIQLPHLKDLDQKICSFLNCDNYGICIASNPIPMNDDTRTNNNEFISSNVEHLRLIICRKWI